MRLLEILTATICGIGLIFKLIGIKEWFILVPIGFLILAGIYFYFGFFLFNNIPIKKIFKKETFKGIENTRAVLTATAGIPLSTAIVGILYHLLPLEGSAVLINFGLLGSIIFGFTSFFLYRKDKQKFYYLNIFIRSAAVVVVSLIITLMPSP